MKAYTDIEQSKMLAEFLSLDSADMRYAPFGDAHPWFNDKISLVEKDSTPCWSLSALLDVLPEGVIDICYAPNIQKENGEYSIAYGNDELLCIADNPIDACYEMIVKLHEQKLL